MGQLPAITSVCVRRTGRSEKALFFSVGSFLEGLIIRRRPPAFVGIDRDNDPTKNILPRIENEPVYGMNFSVGRDVFGAKSGLPFAAETTPGRPVGIGPVINARRYGSFQGGVASEKSNRDISR